MSAYAYERLSAQDSSLLLFEGPTTHMHLSGTTIFKRGPLATAAGGVDIDRIRAHIASRLHRIPRYRRRLAYVPLENHPVWIDDDRLNLDYHVRHTSLPRPGDEEQLKRLSGRILSQQLDRGKPLWEAWVVEGLEGDRFALILKTHHCVIDGLSGVDLLSVLLRPTPDEAIEAPPAWHPCPAPTQRELLRDEILRRAAAPLDLGRTVRSLWREPDTVRAQLTENLSAAWQMVGHGLRRSAETPLNGTIGPFRRCDWRRMDLRLVKDVKNRLGGTINDVVLATVAGALRRFLSKRHVKVDQLDYRALVPVSVRSAAEPGDMGNRLSAWLMSLPVTEPHPLERYRAVRRLTHDLKQSQQVHGTDVLIQVAELAAPILTLGVRLAARMSPYNLIVTNVPGPQVPLYLLGARLLEGYPQVPLFENQGLAVTVLSYTGSLFWGLNADWDLVPDLGDFADAIVDAFRELYEATAGVPQAADEFAATDGGCARSGPSAAGTTG